MSVSVKNLPLNYENCSKIAKRVMRDNNMHIATRPVPLETSVYTFEVNPSKKILISLSEDLFSYSEITKANNKWDVTKKYSVKGSINKVEDAFLEAVKNIKILLNRK